MVHTFNRRSFIQRAGQASGLMLAGGALEAALAACGGNVSTSTSSGSQIPSTGLLLSGSLQWGATSSNGAPYVYQNPAGTGLVGFEYEIAIAIAKLMGVTQKQVEVDYAQLQQALQSKKIDIIMNGWEITDDRKQTELFSQSYYHFGQQIVVRSDDTRFANKTATDDLSLKDLEGLTVGTGAGFKAETILQSDAKITEKSYDPDLPFNDLALGRIDAVLIDLPTVSYYVQGAGAGGQQNKALKLIGKPFELSDYVIAVNKSGSDATTLLHEIDQAITQLKSDGTLRKIYQKWGLWNDQQAQIGIK